MFKNYNLTDRGTAKLDGDIVPSDVILNLVNIEDLPESNSTITLVQSLAGVFVKSEKIYYTTRTGNVLTGVTRGYAGSTAKSFNDGDDIRLNIIAEHIIDIQTEVTRLETDKADKSNTYLVSEVDALLWLKANLEEGNLFGGNQTVDGEIVIDRPDASARILRFRRSGSEHLAIYGIGDSDTSYIRGNLWKLIFFVQWSGESNSMVISETNGNIWFWAHIFDERVNIKGNVKLFTGSNQVNGSRIGWYEGATDPESFWLYLDGQANKLIMDAYNKPNIFWVDRDTGKFGFGTVNPAEVVDVLGNIRAKDSNGTARAIKIIPPNDSDLFARVLIENTVSSLRFGTRDYENSIHIDGVTGKVGIFWNTAPEYELQLESGSFWVWRSTSDYNTRITNNSFEFRRNGNKSYINQIGTSGILSFRIGNTTGGLITNLDMEYNITRSFVPQFQFSASATGDKIFGMSGSQIWAIERTNFGSNGGVELKGYSRLGFTTNTGGTAVTGMAISPQGVLYYYNAPTSASGERIRKDANGFLKIG